ncbi:MAG: site-2 protease family protein [Lachnospiraceae bacterium]|nr:site-2 protease family protein [Lachnospiraceae bacterium]
MKLILHLYCIIAFSVVFHELGHLLAAVVLHVKVEKIHIGTGNAWVHWRKIEISPLIFSAYVVFEEKKLYSISKKGILLMGLSGAAVNLLFLAMGIFLLRGMDAIFCTGTQFALLVVNLLPFENTDMGRMIRLGSKE